jgi:MscS family membrane protein
MTFADFSNLFSVYTDWTPGALLIGLAVLAVLFLAAELLMALLIRRSGSSPADGVFVVPPGVFRVLRIGVRFGLPILFLNVIRAAEVPSFPENFLFHGPVYVLLFIGSLSLLFRTVNLLTPDRPVDTETAPPRRTLRQVSRRSLKTALFFLGFSLLLWRVLALLPQGFQVSRIVSGIIIVNGIFLLTLLLLVVRRVFSAAEEMLSHGEQRAWAPILLHSLAVPVRLLIVALAVVWLRPLSSGMDSVYRLMGQGAQLLTAAAVMLFLFRAAELAGTSLSRYSDQDTNSLDRTLIEMVRMLVRILILGMGVFIAIRIITGKPLTTLLAGLGIGGLAVALAAQDTLKNFFGSIMIMTDKPFKIGERIQVEGYDGTVEAIGFRSSRIRTLTGHQVVMPNDKMAMASIENVGRRPHIRRLTNITVTYNTSPEKMERALEIIRGILENHEGMPEDLPPRVYFSEFNADSLNILVLYWYAPPDYWKFMEFSEKVNLTIMKEFNREGIEFAFPTTTTYLEQTDGQALRLEMGNGGPFINQISGGPHEETE